MVVMILEKVPPSLRGNLTRWLVELHPGVFAGKISALVREELWKMCLETRSVGGMIQLWSAANEQGFDARCYGETSRTLVDYEGLWLSRRKRKTRNKDDPKTAENPENSTDSPHET